MNAKVLACRGPVVLASLLFVLGACQQKKIAPAQSSFSEITSHDQVAPSPVGTSINILHKTFAITAQTHFPFQVPPHATRPQLHGTYRSFVQGVGSAAVNDQNANVDFLIMNEEQYADFARGRQGETLFSTEASHNQDVAFGLPASQDQPQKYFLVFRKSMAGTTPIFVDAHFGIDF
jgi:hypothetical protein